MTKIEQVARAILKARQARGLSGEADWEFEPAKIQRIYLDTARAAIKAMREPAVEVVEASYKAAEMRLCNSPEAAKALFRDVLWPAAIDAILNEEPTP